MQNYKLNIIPKLMEFMRFIEYIFELIQAWAPVIVIWQKSYQNKD